MRYGNQMRPGKTLKLIVALWSSATLGATSSPPASAQVTTPETATLPATPAVTPPDTPVLVIADNELRLDGTVAAVNVAQNSLTLDVSSFTLPSGKTQALAAPKPKSVLITAHTWLHPVNDATQKVTLSDVAMGTALVVIGKDAGTGHALTAREIGTEPAIAAPAPGDATVPATAPTTEPTAGGDAPTAADLAALRQTLTIRITQLQAELQQLKTTPDVYTKAQVNELLAAQHGEFESSLQNLSRRVMALEAAAHRGGPGAGR